MSQNNDTVHSFLALVELSLPSDNIHTKKALAEFTQRLESCCRNLRVS